MEENTYVGITEEFLLGPVDRLGGLVIIARRAGDPGSIPGQG